MKRIILRKNHHPTLIKPNVDESSGNTKIADAFVSELKQKLETVVDNVRSIPDDHTLPTTPASSDELELSDFDVEIPEDKQSPVITKESIKIHTPDIEVEDLQHENKLIEMNTVLLNETIKANEECFLKITPIAKKKIKHVLSANLIFNKVCDNVLYNIVENSDPFSFSLYVKNNRNEDLNVKVSYHVVFCD